jgi:hypothetical protein
MVGGEHFEDLGCADQCAFQKTTDFVIHLESLLDHVEERLLVLVSGGDQNSFGAILDHLNGVELVIVDAQNGSIFNLLIDLENIDQVLLELRIFNFFVVSFLSRVKHVLNVFFQQLLEVRSPKMSFQKLPFSRHCSHKSPFALH